MADSKEEGHEGAIPPKIDRVIHEPGRLSIMAHLYVVESADFLYLQRQTKLTEGNLSAHIARLEAVGYLAVKKEFVDKKPHTVLHLTEKGRTEFQTYCKEMKQFFDEFQVKTT